MNNSSTLWRATGINTLVSILLFGALLLCLYAAEHFFPELTLLKWSDKAWCVGIPASIIGVAYILSIKNPANYTGFYAGILMSALLGIQFYLQGNVDLTFLYFAIFIPFQIKSILNWSKPADNGNDEPFSPEFLSMKGMLLSLLVFAAITVADYFLATKVINPLPADPSANDYLLALFGALMISSSVLANFWLIYRKTDSWVYWLIYSVSGIAFYVILGNAFSIVLFSFFLVINSMAGIAWLRMTDEEHKGWLKGK